MPHYHRLIIYFDGASRNNPQGPAGCGWVIYEMNRSGANSDHIAEDCNYLGYDITSNQAEYEGLEAALQYMCNNDISCHGLYIRGDSQLVINQVDGIYQVESPNLTGYHGAVMGLIDNIDKTFVKCKHIDRSRNWEADQLANKAINDAIAVSDSSSDTDNYSYQGYVDSNSSSDSDDY